MTDQEIFEILCSHMMILDKKNPMDNPIFKHCYDICIQNKDKITDGSWCGFEIKLGANQIEAVAEKLLKIKEEKLTRVFYKKKIM